MAQPKPMNSSLSESECRAKINTGRRVHHPQQAWPKYECSEAMGSWNKGSTDFIQGPCIYLHRKALRGPAHS